MANLQDEDDTSAGASREGFGVTADDDEEDMDDEQEDVDGCSKSGILNAESGEGVFLLVVTR